MTHGKITNAFEVELKENRIRIVYYIFQYLGLFGPGSVVGIATSYGLDGPGIESRWGARFSAPVQTGSEAHPASCKWVLGLFRE
jgi:hypothetical protein